MKGKKQKINDFEAPDVKKPKEGLLEKPKIENKKPDFSYEYLRFVNSINNDRDLLIDFFNKDHQEDEAKSKENNLNSISEDVFKPENGSGVDILSFDEKSLAKEGQMTLDLLRKYEYSHLNISYSNENRDDINIEEALDLLQRLEEIKVKNQEFIDLANNKIDQIDVEIEELTIERNKLNESLRKIRNEFVLKRMFKKNEIEELSKKVLALNNKIIEQEYSKRKISSRISDFKYIADKVFYHKDYHVKDYLIKGYFINIREEIKNLEGLFLSEEMIERMDDDYIDKNFRPYLFDYDGNDEYLSGMDEISQEDKESCLKMYKEYLSFSRGHHMETYNLSPEEKKEHKRRLEIFNKVSQKMEKVYFSPSIDLRKFGLYQSQSNDSFNNEYKALLGTLFSGFYNLEKESRFLELQDKIKGEDEDLLSPDDLSDNSVLGLTRFKNIRKLYPYIKNLLIDSGIMEKEKIEEIEESMIEKLYNKYISKGDYDSSDGQEAIGVMSCLNGVRSIPFFIEYIKNSKGGHVRSSCLHSLINAMKDLSDRDEKDIFEKFKKEDRIVLEKLLDKKSYFFKNILSSDFDDSLKKSLMADYLLVAFLKNPEIFELQEKAGKLLEENGESEEEIVDFYAFGGNDLFDHILEYANKSGENKETVLKMYQKLFLENSNNFDIFVKITVLLENYKEVFDLIVESGEYEHFFYYDNLLEKFGYQKVINVLVDNNCVKGLLENRDKFKGNVNDSEIVNKLIKKGEVKSVADWLYLFDVLDEETSNSLVDIFIEESYVYCLFQDIEKLKGVGEIEIINKLIKNGKIKDIANNLHFFNNLDEKMSSTLLEFLMEGSYFSVLLQNRHKFKNINDIEIFDKLFDAGAMDDIVNDLNFFRNLDEKRALVLINNGYINQLALNIDSFKDSDSGVLSIFKRVKNSPSLELKNISAEIIIQLINGGPLSTIEERYNKIEEVYVKNNIPFVGKQFKVCEALYPGSRMGEKAISPELSGLKNASARKLLIFKDLLRANFDSANSNLKKYLEIFNSVDGILKRYEKGQEVSDQEIEKIRYFINKINAFSQNIKKDEYLTRMDPGNIDLDENLKILKKNFGVKKGQTLIERFEEVFLKRVGINSIPDAINYLEDLTMVVTNRNRGYISGDKLKLEKNDLAKGINIDFFDKYLDRGVFSPEFIGSETSTAKSKAEKSDYTPWDTDLILVENSDSSSIVENSIPSSFGDIILIIKDRGQFNKTEVGQPVLSDKNKLELFKTGAMRVDHYGIRTGFGSSEISAVFVKDLILNDEIKLDYIKFSIARKGFYIPICDKNENVVFSHDDFIQYRKIFNGIGLYSKEEMEISSTWSNSDFSDDIEGFVQTKDNIDKIINIRNKIQGSIREIINSLGVDMHLGEHDDSILGVEIIDTGSTGRGSALDNNFDFDFVVKLNDNDYNEVDNIISKLKDVYPLDNDYTNNAMRTCRFKELEVSGVKVELDVSFVKRSNSQNLSANDAILQKYNSIKNNFGEEKLFEVLGNVRFAKKLLKDHGCYKKGLSDGGRLEGGLGGIGVENWILKNDGDVVLAFRDFYNYAYKDGELVSFDDFKRSYKVFGAGENIRGGVIAENFVYNMDPSGYAKMAEISKRFVS